MKSVDRKIKAAAEKVQRLHSISASLKSFQEYRQSADLKDIAERNLQVAIESCLDMGKIIISIQKLPEPLDNKSIFAILAEAGVISQNTLEFMVPMAGTRNILVHGYDKVDDALIYGVLKKHLHDFDTFFKEIKSYVTGMMSK